MPVCLIEDCLLGVFLAIQGIVRIYGEYVDVEAVSGHAFKVIDISIFLQFEIPYLISFTEVSIYEVNADGWSVDLGIQLNIKKKNFEAVHIKCISKEQPSPPKERPHLQFAFRR